MNARWSFSALLLATAVAGASLVRANDTPRIQVAPAQPRVGAPLQIDVDAAWRDTCPPRFESARIDGFDITILAVRDATRCDGGETAYRVSAGLDEAAALRPEREGVYRVRYAVREGENAVPELHGFRLLQVGDGADAGFVPETGFWWPELGGEHGRAGPGIGVQIEVQSGTVSVSALGYAQDRRAGWFFGVGALTGRIAHLDMSLLDGGAGPFEAYASPKSVQVVGQVELEVISPSRAVLWFVRTAGAGQPMAVEPMSVVRFSFAQDPGEALVGRWLIVPETDDGRAPRRIALTRIERKAGELALRDASGEHALVCESPAALPNSPPGLCRLESASSPDDGVEFTDVGLQQMRGWDGAGRRILAFRIDP